MELKAWGGHTLACPWVINCLIVVLECLYSFVTLLKISQRFFFLKKCFRGKGYVHHTNAIWIKCENVKQRNSIAILTCGSLFSIAGLCRFSRAWFIFFSICMTISRTYRLFLQSSRSGLYSNSIREWLRIMNSILSFKLQSYILYLSVRIIWMVDA